MNIEIVFLIATALASVGVYIVVAVVTARVLCLSPQWTLRTALLLGVYNALLYFVSIALPTDFWGNRIQHAVAGGAFASFMWYVVCTQLHAPFTRVQFFILSMLLVTGLGVGYELLEFIGEMTTGFSFQTSEYDTWFDLASNTVGAVIAGVVFTLIYPQVRREGRSQTVLS